MTSPQNRYTCRHIFSEASKTITLWLGAMTAVVLIASSLTMAMAVWASQAGKKKLLTLFLVATLVLGCVFLGIKGVEYHDKYVEHHIPGWNFNFEPGADVATNAHTQLFFSLYFVITRLHPLHTLFGPSFLLCLLNKTPL